MASLLSAQPDNTDDVVKYINDCRANGIRILPPDVNRSEKDFSIEDGNIRFGLGAIKGLGEKAIESLIEARTGLGGFRTLKDFLEHVDMLTVNKGVLEALIKAGAFDSVHNNRAQLFGSVDLLIDTARRLQEDRLSGQGNLFDQGAEKTVPGAGILTDLPDIRPWHDNEKLTGEKEVLGLYISGHPLAKYEHEITTFACTPISELGARRNGGDYSIVGIVANLKVRMSKNGRRFAVGVVEDMEGSLEAIFFPDTFAKYEAMLTAETPLMVKGTVEFEEETPKKIIVNEIKSLREVRRETISSIHIKLDTVGIDEGLLDSLRSVISRNRGKCPVYFHIREARGREKIVKAHQSFNIAPTEELFSELSRIVGDEAVRYAVRNC
jgi:DNA polymerase-3 subunit alpha